MKNSAKLLYLCVWAVTAFACSDITSQQHALNETGVSLHTELGGSAAGFERACGPREFSFPADHGAHPSFRNEWWYITGNLESDSKRFGFHATFFRIASRSEHGVKPSEQVLESDWVTDEFYMAHFAITEAGADKVSAHERFSRAAAGLAGAEVKSASDDSASDDIVRVWLDDWSLKARQLEGDLVWQLSLADAGDAIDLTLRATKPLVLQGDEGYSQKSSDPCNSSYYYSLTRLQGTGKLLSNGAEHDVSGSAWLDREWSSSALADDQAGWDWFALQLDDGRDIMFYLLRKRDGNAEPNSYAVEIDRNGIKKELPASMLDIHIDEWWQSPSGARYPVAGKIHRKDNRETIVFRPLIKNQELDFVVRYWEGAIELTDSDGRSTGRGYLEMTGY